MGPKKKNNDIPDLKKKEILEELRNKKTEIGETCVNINRFKTEILSINENIYYLKDVTTSLGNELSIRKKTLEMQKKQYDSIKENKIETKKNDSFLSQIKIKTINEKFYNILNEIIINTNS